MSKLEEVICEFQDPLEVQKFIGLMLSKIALSLDNVVIELIYLNERLEK